MLTGNGKTKRSCPNCGSRTYADRVANGAVESLLHILRIVPFRCDDCHQRFFRKTT